MRQAYRIEIPRIVRQPLLGPAPVVVAAGLRVAQIEGNAVLIVQPGGDAVDDRTGALVYS